MNRNIQPQERRTGSCQIIFRSGVSEQGYVFKDEYAFNHHNNSVCYIPEASFDNCDGVRYDSPEEMLEDIRKWRVYTRYSMQRLVAEFLGKDFLSHADYDKMQRFITHLTCIVFDTLDWQCPETLLNELDIDEIWEDFSIEDDKRQARAKAKAKRFQRK